MSALAQKQRRPKAEIVARKIKANDAGLTMASVLLLFASGAASLIFQVLWVKQLSLVVGIEVFAVTVGVGGFFFGLAFGSLVLGRLADRIARPLRLYALSEIGAACLGIVTTRALAAAPPLFARLEAHSGLAAWIMVFVLVGLPAILMGGTFPAIVRTFVAPRPDGGGAEGRLYAANTAGATTGALLPPFILIPWLGIQGSAHAAAILGFIAGAAALVLDQRAAATPAPSVKKRSAPLSHNNRIALLLYAVSGGIALGYEIIWSQSIIPLMSTRSYAFAIVLATYLAGVALGAGLFARRVTRAKDPWGLFGTLIAAAGFLSLMTMLGLGQWIVTAQTFAEWIVLNLTGSTLAGMCARFAMAAAIVVLPPTLLLGAAFPAALRLILDEENPAGRIGATVACNIFGGILGTFVTGFCLVPCFGLVRSLEIFACAAVAIGIVAMAWGGSSRRPLRLTMSAIALATLAVIVALPAGKLMLLFPGADKNSVAFYAESNGGTVAVLEQKTASHQFRRLYVQGVSNSGDAMPSLRYMRLQALVPLIVHRATPHTALVIGYGTGITAGALLRFPELTTRVVAELLPAVLQAAPLFHGTFGAASDPRLEIRLRDGRRELQQNNQAYDMITLEPPPPSAAGVVNLYSTDFYRLAAARLRPAGIIAQWLPLATQNEEDTRSLIRSFVDVFPYACLWTTELHEMLLLGSSDPIELDLPRITQRYNIPDVAAALAEIGIRSPEALLATYVMDRDGLVHFAADAPPVTDDRPRIEYADWLRRSSFGATLSNLLNQRSEPRLSGGDDAARSAIASRQEELFTFYNAAMNAYAGNRSAWARDMRRVMEADSANPYYNWFLKPSAP